jgi:PKD domain-containing protein
MKLPVFLIISVVAVLASSFMLAGVFSLDSIILSTGHDTYIQKAGAQALPFEVRDRFSEKKFAGDANNIEVNEDFVDPENHCEFCTFIEYTPGPRGAAGFAYESDAGLDLTDAKKMRFWIMGEEGNERIKFKIAGKSFDNIEDRRPNRPTNSIFESERFALTTEEVTLASDWRRYEVDLSGIDLDDITHPFGFELSKGIGAQKQVIYIKGLVFDDAPVEEEYALATVNEEEVITLQPLTVEIIPNGTQGVAPTTFEFEANLTGGTEPYTSIWNFGDGSEESNEQTVSHTFEEAGTYNITLTATDTDDQTASDSVEIQVEEVPEVDEEEEAVQEQAVEEQVEEVPEVDEEEEAVQEQAVEEQVEEVPEVDQIDGTENSASSANNTRQ